MIIATLAPLQVTIFTLVGLGATALVLTRDPLKMVIVSGLYGWCLTLLFFVLSAPDVALSMLVVSTVGYPVILLVAVARGRHK
ncbi:MAG TPA: hydrogenase subunit MbhD domain-containing protein [Gaiellaceae bacterium]|nr:hydrogenase subunit MbhD domain-containing protein [Gaiellaceae bacterium]